MYSVKQNQLIMGALPLADVTVYYMDVRAVGKGYDEFYEQAGHGSQLRRAASRRLPRRRTATSFTMKTSRAAAAGEAEHDWWSWPGVQPDTRRCSLTTLPQQTSTSTSVRPRGPGSGTDRPARRFGRRSFGAKDIPNPSFTPAPRRPQAAAYWRK
jgi:heterodisulfide reductase subunit A